MNDSNIFHQKLQNPVQIQNFKHQLLRRHTLIETQSIGT